jgi:hypothetical protein
MRVGGGLLQCYLRVLVVPISTCPRSSAAGGSTCPRNADSLLECYLRVLVVPLQEEKRCRTKHEGVCAPVRPLKASWTCSLRAHTKEYADGRSMRACSSMRNAMCPTYKCRRTYMCVPCICVLTHVSYLYVSRV